MQMLNAYFLFRPSADKLSALVQEDGPDVVEGCLGSMQRED